MYLCPNSTIFKYIYIECSCIWITLLSKGIYKCGYNDAVKIKANNKILIRKTTNALLSEVYGMTGQIDIADK